MTSGSSQILRDHTYHACVGNKPKGKKQKTRNKNSMMIAQIVFLNMRHMLNTQVRLKLVRHY